MNSPHAILTINYKDYLAKITRSENNNAEGLTLEFSENPFNLKKWIIEDTFGESTTVLIQKAIYNESLSHLLFFPDDFPEPNNSD